MLGLFLSRTAYPQGVRRIRTAAKPLTAARLLGSAGGPTWELQVQSRQIRRAGLLPGKGAGALQCVGAVIVGTQGELGELL